MANRFISDLHFSHANIIKYDGRPFTSLQEHDEYIVKEWNKVVSPEDDVYILGDIVLVNGVKTIEYRKEILSRLNGKLHLVKGNHDGKDATLHQSKSFESISELEKLVLPNGTHIIMCHYPLMSWAHMYKGSYHLYGHVHNFTEDAYQVENYKHSYEVNGKPLKMYNVCASLPWINYVPRTLEEIVAGYEAHKESYLTKLRSTHADRVAGERN
jgi:calcineurin-like phosphoesterase family protein